MEANHEAGPVFRLNLDSLKRSKYVMMLIFSYVDYSFPINTYILNNLNQQFRRISRSRGDECLNILVKTKKIFSVTSEEDLQLL